MNTLAELVAYIESRFQSVEGLPTARCQTGDAYVLIGECLQAWNGTSRAPGTYDGGDRRARYDSENEAINAARNAFDAYAVDKSGVLYWRNPPRMIEPATSRPQWAVYLRLVVTDRPALWPDMATFEAWESDRHAA